MKKYIIYVSGFFVLVFFFSCKRNSDKITTNPQAKLSFSQEIITFDTIFSSIGSVTKRLWVYNNNKQAVKVSSIQLARLNNSSYTLTIDGEEKLEWSDYEILGNDSMLVLVKVLIDPQNQSLAYLVDDSIVFSTNGNIQDVDLLAYGQDAFFLSNTSVPCNTTWINTKPYVITGEVLVPSGCTLTIDKGTRIRFHKDATLKVAGTLIVQGAKDSLVTFRHDNLSNFYSELPGQWGGITFLTGSKNNLLSFTEIKNATNAITMQDEPDADTIAEVKLENSVVKNCSENALTIASTDFYAVNSLIGNATGYVVYLPSGGNCYFDFCTLVNYSYDFFRNAPSIKFSNQGTSSANDLKAKFRNCIVWGDKTEEIEIDNNGTNLFDLSADYSLLKSTLSITNNNTLFNQDPNFENEYTKNFHLKSTSPAIDSGIPLPLLTTDLEGTIRGINPDRGCYEK